MAKITKEGELVYSDGRLIGFIEGASTEARQKYIDACEWEPTVEAFVPTPNDVIPDGRLWTGDRVGDLGPDENGHAKVAVPNGNMQDIDLSSYGDDDRVRISWQNKSRPTPGELGPTTNGPRPMGPAIRPDQADGRGPEMPSIPGRAPHRVSRTD